MPGNDNTTEVTEPPEVIKARAAQQVEQGLKDCLACRIIGSAALGGTGVYALNMSRAHQPGSPFSKRIMAGLGVCFLVGSVFRWTK